MEMKRKWVSVCLVCIIMVAIVAGLISYYHQAQESRKISEGTLIIVCPKEK